MSTTTDLDATLAPLAAELATILAAKADLELREKDLKARIRELAPAGDKYQAGNLVVTVTAASRFNEKKALSLLPEAVLPLVTYPETRVDKDRLKVLAPDVYDASLDTFDARVSVR